MKQITQIFLEGESPTLNKYFCIENQMQEEETMRKAMNLM